MYLHDVCVSVCKCICIEGRNNESATHRNWKFVQYKNWKNKQKNFIRKTLKNVCFC